MDVCRRDAGGVGGERVNIQESVYVDVNCECELAIRASVGPVGPVVKKNKQADAVSLRGISSSASKPHL